MEAGADGAVDLDAVGARDFWAGGVDLEAGAFSERVVGAAEAESLLLFFALDGEAFGMEGLATGLLEVFERVL